MCRTTSSLFRRPKTRNCPKIDRGCHFFPPGKIHPDVNMHVDSYCYLAASQTAVDRILGHRDDCATPASLGIKCGPLMLRKGRNPLLLCLCLLLDIMLGTSLLRLACVVLSLVLGLLGAVTGQTSNGAPDCASDAVGCSRGEIIDLTTRLLLLTLLPWLLARYPPEMAARWVSTY